MKHACSAILLVGGLLSCNPSHADTTVDYAIGSGFSSNIFEDTTDLPSVFSEAKLGLRGSLDLEGTTLSYNVHQTERRVRSYDFADGRRSTAEIGYKADLSEALSVTLATSLTREEKGDVYLIAPNLPLGYRETNLLFDNAASLSLEAGGGKTTFSAGYAAIDRGDARFILPGLKATRLEAKVDAVEFSGNHVRPLFGGEGGVYAQYRRSIVTGADQAAFGRLPAETLRGSLAYGRRIGADITLLADIGTVAVYNPRLGGDGRPRPYLRAEAEWKAPADLTLSAAYLRDIAVTGIDDAVAEYVGTWKFAATRPVTDRVEAGIGYERADSSWLAADYSTTTERWTAVAKLALPAGSAIIVEYGRLNRQEADAAGNFKAHQVAARLAGSF